MMLEKFPNVPAKPVGFMPSVKSKSRTAWFDVSETLPVPAVNLNEMLLASVTAPGVIVLDVALELVQIIKGVPVTVMVVAPVKIVPVLFNDMVFVPKLNVPVKPAKLKVCTSALMSSVTVPEPESPSNLGPSTETGTDAPGAPPELTDQLEVSFQLPVPPETQNLKAMLTPQ
jgi:hypothetical protein